MPAERPGPPLPQATPPEPGRPAAADIVRAAFTAAAQRRARVRPGVSPARSGGVTGPATARVPDAQPREPVALGQAVRDLVERAGWGESIAASSIAVHWPTLVGPDLAAHCHPVGLTGGELRIEADSTAWATQVRLLTRDLLTRIHAELGAQVVRDIRIHGPVAPSWRHGTRRVAGPGPRDTYG